MKRLISLFTFLIASCFAEPYQDPIGFSLEMPVGLERSIDFTHHQTGLEIILFLPKEFGEGAFLAGIYKLPDGKEEALEEICDLIRDQLEEIFGDEDDDFASGIQLHFMPSLIEERESQRFRLYIVDENYEEPSMIDVHSFEKHGANCVILTASLFSSNEERFDAFTQAVVGSVKFDDVE